MEQTERSETSAYKIETPGNYPKENILYPDSMKSRTRLFHATNENDLESRMELYELFLHMFLKIIFSCLRFLNIHFHAVWIWLRGSDRIPHLSLSRFLTIGLFRRKLKTSRHKTEIAFASILLQAMQKIMPCWRGWGERRQQQSAAAGTGCFGHLKV